VQLGELLDRHRARFEQPSEIGGEVRDGGFHQHPAARLVCPAQAFEYCGVDAGRWILKKRPCIQLGLDVMRAHEIELAASMCTPVVTATAPSHSSPLLIIRSLVLLFVRCFLVVFPPINAR
jgi:hypothetical protein